MAVMTGRGLHILWTAYFNIVLQYKDVFKNAYKTAEQGTTWFIY